MKVFSLRFGWALALSFTALGLLTSVAAFMIPAAGLLTVIGIALAAAIAVVMRERTVLAASVTGLALLLASVSLVLGDSLPVRLVLAVASCLTVGTAAAFTRRLLGQFQMQQMQLGVWQNLRERLERRATSTTTSLEEGKTLLAQELYRAQRYGRPLSIVLLSIEGVRSEPERSYTPPELLTLAAVLQQVLRQTDHIVPVRRDQFLVILPETNAEGAVIVMRRVVELAQEYGLVLRGGVVTHPYQGSDPDDLLMQAETALHRAQEANRTAGTL